MTRVLLLAALALACVVLFVLHQRRADRRAWDDWRLYLHHPRAWFACMAAAGLALALLSAGPAFAAEVVTIGDKAVILPYGQWITAIAQTATEILIPVIVAFLGIASRKLPWLVSMYLTEARIDRMVRLAADYALNAVKDAAAEKTLSVDVGYTVLKVGLERAIGSSPRWLIDAAGSEKGITERLFRAFRFDESVTDANTLTPLLRDLGADLAARG